MTNVKVSQMTQLLAADVAVADDYVPIIDASVADASKNKRITVDDIGTALNVGTPDDGSVTTDKLADGAVTHPKVTYNTGQVIQSAYSEVTARNSANVAIPLDDTIPQVTEGIELLTVSITPKFTTSKLRVRFQGWGMNSTGGHTQIAALFRDGAANAVAATAHAPELTALFSGNMILEHQESAGSTSETTFSLRVGATGGILFMNGNSGNRLFGGVSKCTLVVEEIAG